MTEADAKTKWCPFARTKTTAFGLDNAGPAGVNRDFDGVPVDRLHTCLASACMAWRRQYWPQTERHRMINDRLKLTGEPHPDAVSWVNRLEEEAAEGFCGLAGAPQP